MLFCLFSVEKLSTHDAAPTIAAPKDLNRDDDRVARSINSARAWHNSFATDSECIGIELKNLRLDDVFHSSVQGAVTNKSFHLRPRGVGFAASLWLRKQAMHKPIPARSLPSYNAKPSP
jgi:hypothetical protein